MKRLLYFSLAVFSAAILGAWIAARTHVESRARESAEKAELEAQAKARKPALYFAALAREADEAVISYGGASGKRQVRLNDPLWISRLSSILGSGLYRQTAHGLWMSTPQITLYRKKTQILELMSLGAVLRVYGEQMGGDYIVGEELTAGVLELAKKEEPNQASEPMAPSGRG